MMPAKVSIVVPIYNVEAYLEKALASIQQQSYRELKVIMVNDGSTDHSVEIAQSFSRIHVLCWYHKKIKACRQRVILV